MNRGGTGQTMMMKAVDFSKGPSYEVIICGDNNSDRGEEIIKKINNTEQPNKVIIWVNKNNIDDLEQMMPFIKYFPLEPDNPLIYVCQNYTCDLPTTDIDKVLNLLSPPK